MRTFHLSVILSLVLALSVGVSAAPSQAHLEWFEDFLGVLPPGLAKFADFVIKPYGPEAPPPLFETNGAEAPPPLFEINGGGDQGLIQPMGAEAPPPLWDNWT